MSFEKAYAFYRKKNDTAALGVIRKLDGSVPRVMELKAQILYRMEQYQEALELFKKLIRTHSDEFDDIRRANLIAVKARLQSQGDAQELDLANLESFETMYNTSCHMIACQKFDDALRLLEKTAVECERSLNADGLGKEEIQQEMAPILAQKAFTLQKLDQKKEALKLYQNVLKTKALNWKLKSAIVENLEADYVKFGKKWRPMKRAHGDGEEDGAEGAADAVTKSRRKTRKRKRRLPANSDPQVPLDPERWLPRQERTAYRKKLHKKYKDRDIGRGTQGTSASAVANMDYSSSSAKPGPSGGTPSPHPSPKPEGPRQQRPAGQQAKKGKKKKGGKW
ncbi:hypothetical protein niasHS_007223 [Heterodera schachtii]|uniref:Signal recognition particle subunit SRP72 n=1 Tax=Heterodera schachtii TaxID=97005 RepID=A0ABD2JK53_HETSC